MIAEIHNKSYEDFVNDYISSNRDDVNDGGNSTLKIINALVKDIKIFSMDGDIKKVLMETNNKIHEKPLPFSQLFVDVNFFEEDFKVQGLWIGENFSPKDAIKKRYPLYINKEFTSGERMISFHLFFIKNPSRFYAMSIPIFSDVKKHWKERLLNDFKEVNFDFKHLMILHKKIQLFTNNFIDFLNHPNVETKVIKWHNNEKRISRGQKPIPDRVKIDIKGKLYRYIYEDMPKQQSSSPKNSFWIRGHYIHFWNKKRYNRVYSFTENELEEKGYYKDKQGIVCKWILPYIKGSGELKEKLRRVK